MYLMVANEFRPRDVTPLRRSTARRTDVTQNRELATLWSSGLGTSSYINVP